ncbi:MAG: MBL fold metallo-hydrolase [Bacteroidia bacterium]|nr:MBL fold metallo-hydrolase [Bacteroidia bacterium]MDW8346934.1 MBL fold metallo-hydrolase [Bacteroidia bacterium]
MNVHSFTFNLFSENTYILTDNHSKQCVIIDPGCSNYYEQNILMDFIQNQQLKPVLLLNTHCHIDHVFGNQWVKDTFNIPFYAHQKEIDNLHKLPMYAPMFGIPPFHSPFPDKYIDEKDTITFSKTTLTILFTPGHSVGSICFYHADSHQIISGDVLFNGSIGRYDLPGGNFYTLIESIKTKLLTLPNQTTVYSGHGPATTIGHERYNNPFLIS